MGKTIEGTADLAIDGSIYRYDRRWILEDVRRLSLIDDWYSAFLVLSQWVIVLFAETVAIWLRHRLADYQRARSGPFQRIGIARSMKSVHPSFNAGAIIRLR